VPGMPDDFLYIDNTREDGHVMDTPV